MTSVTKKNRSTYFLAILSTYIVLQFLWWGYMLIVENPKKATMVIGESLVKLPDAAVGIQKLFENRE